MIAPVVEITNLKKVYMLGKVPVNALCGVDVNIEKGDFITILGPSGSGKSTLLNMIGALDKPTEGKVLTRARAHRPFKLLSSGREFSQPFFYAYNNTL